MPKFRRLPTEIDAEQFTGKRPYPVGVCECGLLLSGIKGGCQPHVHTIHDGQRVDLTPGDWVAAEADGKHYYPIKPDVFEQTYEPVLE